VNPQPANPIIAFFKGVKVELDQVNWPNHQETMRLTIIVIAGCVLVGLYIGGIDALFIKILTNLINR
jgi:preprotein translocase SecE subunit